MVKDIIKNPDKFYERASNKVVLRGPLLTVTLVALSVLIAPIYLRIQLAPLYATSSALQIVSLINMFSTFGSIFLLWLFYAGMFHLIAIFVFGGDGEFRDTIKLIGWGFFPKIISGTISSLAVFVAMTEVAMPQSVDQISAFSTTIQNHYLLQAAAIIGVVIIIWQGFLWTFAIKHGYDLDYKKSVYTVVPMIVLSLSWNIYTLI